MRILKRPPTFPIPLCSVHAIASECVDGTLRVHTQPMIQNSPQWLTSVRGLSSPHFKGFSLTTRTTVAIDLSLLSWELTN